MNRCEPMAAPKVGDLVVLHIDGRSEVLKILSITTSPATRKPVSPATRKPVKMNAR